MARHKAGIKPSWVLRHPLPMQQRSEARWICYGGGRGRLHVGCRTAPANRGHQRRYLPEDLKLPKLRSLPAVFVYIVVSIVVFLLVQPLPFTTFSYATVRITPGQVQIEIPSLTTPPHNTDEILV